MSPRRLGVDLTPLRVSSQYRRLYTAGFITALGNQATYVTVPFQLKQLTHSPLAVGAIGLVELVPLVVFGLYGGVLADRLNRRRLIITTEALVMVTMAMLLVNALVSHPQVWLIYVIDAILVGTFSLQRPSIEALNQAYVPHELQRSAAALANIRYTSASIVGPALGGLAAVAIGPAASYLANLVTLGFSLALLVRLRATPRAGGAHSTGGDAKAMREGIRYAASRPDLVGTYVVDLLAMVLAYPVIMLPFVAERFHETYALSLLYLGLPVGALIATLTSSWTHRVHRYGRAIVFAAATWGLGVALFGFAGSLGLCLVGLAVGGAADAISGIFRSTMWNESITSDVRGRMAGIEMISYALGPTAGQFRAGLMAAWTSLRVSLTVGGLACTGSIGAVALALPALWRFDARSDAHVAEVRARRSRDEPPAA